MTGIITITDILEADWRWLCEHLAAEGWRMERGGGLDHSWALLSKGDLQISMDHDRWAEGEIRFAADRRQDILSALPENFVQAYAHTLAAS